MKRILSFFRKNSELFFRGLLFILSVTIIVYFFPRERKFKYEFQKGQPWLHETLIAPFSFPVYKAEEQINLEKDSLRLLFKPYFRNDTSMYRSQLAKAEKGLNTTWSRFISGETDSVLLKKLNSYQLEKYRKVKEKYWDFSKNTLQHLYLRGIVQTNEAIEQVRNHENMIILVKSNVGEEYPAKNFYTLKSAYEYIVGQTDKFPEENNSFDKTAKKIFHHFELTEYIQANVTFDEKTSEKVLNDMFGEISLTEGLVQEGQRIILQGDIINNDTYRILKSLEYEYENQLGESFSYGLILLGQSILVFISILIVFLFLSNFRKEILQNRLKTSFILFLIVGFTLIARFVVQKNEISLYLIPFAIVPIVIRNFYDGRLAVFIHFVTILLIGFWAPNSYEFVFINFAAGITAILSLTNIYRRGRLFLSAILVVLTYSFVYFGMAIIHEGNLSNIEWINFAWFGGNGLFILLSYPLIYVFEKSFGFVSDLTLMELSDTNQPLLRKLAEKAPGTFQHSMQVANMAEEAIFKLEGNPLLVRTGALYHDIGKMDNPQYFIENQSPGYNPHEKLEFDKSAEIIISHVENGIVLAKKYKLPEHIINFIRTHHGDTKVQYFYRSYLNKYPDEKIDVNKFTYPGPRPFSKETAVLMMADSVEAASRSMKNITEDSINDLVDNIINNQRKEGQFELVDLTYKDFTMVKTLFKRKLKNIYHARIEYPKLQNE